MKTGNADYLEKGVPHYENDRQRGPYQYEMGM
jgi:hypothetical protein